MTYVSKEELGIVNDFVVIIKDSDKKELAAHLSKWGPLPETPVLSNLLTIDLRPEIPSKITSAKEIIFLIDCSGSMSDNIPTLKTPFSFTCPLCQHQELTVTIQFISTLSLLVPTILFFGHILDYSIMRLSKRHEPLLMK